MKKHLKRLPAYVVIFGLLAFLIVWCVAMFKIESLTGKYYSDFEYAYLQNSMINDVEYFKVMECDGNTAKVYYVTEEDGNVLYFDKTADGWKETRWETVWSKTGSASGAVWPFWYQVFITGF